MSQWRGLTIGEVGEVNLRLRIEEHATIGHWAHPDLVALFKDIVLTGTYGDHLATDTNRRILCHVCVTVSINFRTEVFDDSDVEW